MSLGDFTGIDLVTVAFGAAVNVCSISNCFSFCELNQPAKPGSKLYRGLTQAGVAAIALYFGGVQDLQNAAIISGLPFSTIMIFMGFSFMKDVNQEVKKT